jgi:uncharacterized protein (DUF305 family)
VALTVYRLDQQIAAVKREIALRERAYPRWVASAKMKPEKSAFELGVMRAVLETLERLQDAAGREQDRVPPPPLAPLPREPVPLP